MIDGVLCRGVLGEVIEPSPLAASAECEEGTSIASEPEYAFRTRDSR
jgi:hypothetical protein